MKKIKLRLTKENELEATIKMSFEELVRLNGLLCLTEPFHEGEKEFIEEFRKHFREDV